MRTGLIDTHTEQPNDWMRDAPCVGYGDEFDCTTAPPSPEIRAICAGCDHVEPCLEWLLKFPEQVGFGAGMSAKQRRSLRRKRRGLREEDDRMDDCA